MPRRRSARRIAATALVAMTAGMSLTGFGEPRHGDPCAVVRSDTAASWQSAKGSGFTMCVPDDWKRSGNEWRSPESPNRRRVLTWSMGPQRVPFQVRGMRPGEVREAAPNPSQAMRDAYAVTPTSSEIVDGRLVTISTGTRSNRFVVLAAFPDDKPVLQFSAFDDSALPVAMDIIRTVRFDR